MQDDTLYEGGFGHAAYDSALAFRAAMRAMARPGTVEEIAGALGPEPVSPAAATLLLTLCDHDTPIHLAGEHDTPAVRSWIAFHTGAPCVGAQEADFALGTFAALQPLSRFKIGVASYPDRAATLIVELDALVQSGARLSGPGIKDTAQLNLPDPVALQANHRQFPLGFDCFFTAAGQIAALPRSTRIEEAA